MMEEELEARWQMGRRSNKIKQEGINIYSKNKEAETGF